METIGAGEAKNDFPRLLKRVAGGETFAITRRGVPIAIIGPPEKASRRTAGEVIDELLRFRETLSLGGLAVRELREEGRR